VKEKWWLEIELSWGLFCDRRRHETHERFLALVIAMVFPSLINAISCIMVILFQSKSILLDDRMRYGPEAKTFTLNYCMTIIL